MSLKTPQTDLNFGGHAMTVNAMNAGLFTDPLNVDYVVLKDDFVGGGTNVDYSTIGELSWVAQVIISGSVGRSWADAEANHPGIFRITAPNTDNAGGFINLYYGEGGAATLRIPPLNGITGWRFRHVVRIGSTADISLRVGLAADPTSAKPATGIWMQYDTDDTDTNFCAVCRNASTETKTASAVAANTGWNTFDIWSDAAGTISFSVNGGTTINISTNVTSSALSPFFCMVNRAASATKTMDVDFWGMKMTVAR